MQDYAGGAVVPGMVDNYPVPQAQRVVYTTESEVRRQLGMDVALPEIAASLQRLDIATEKLEGRPQGSPLHIHSTPAPTDLGNAVFGLHVEADEPLLRCIAPWHRLDIQVPADLTEEVARVIGYEHIKTTLIDDVLPTQHRNLSLETEESIRDILVGCGLQETINYALTVPENHDKINRDPIGTAEQNTPFITLVNPLSAKRRVMRRSMLVSALENLEYNYRYTQRMAVFEIGRVYLPEQGDGIRPYEEPRLSILLVGPRRVSSVHPDPAGDEDFDFFDLKGIVETLLSRLGLKAQEYEFVAKRNSPTFTPTCAQLKIYGEVQGILGELRPQIQADFDVPTAARVYAADIRIAPLMRPSWELRPMEKISNYPPVVEDLAFVVPDEVTAYRLQEAIRKAGGSLLTKVELFDIYRGQPVPADHKSMAYKLTYESLEGNMRDEQVVSIRNRIIRQVAESVGGTLRE